MLYQLRPLFCSPNYWADLNKAALSMSWNKWLLCRLEIFALKIEESGGGLQLKFARNFRGITVMLCCFVFYFFLILINEPGNETIKFQLPIVQVDTKPMSCDEVNQFVKLFFGKNPTVINFGNKFGMLWLVAGIVN